MRRFEMTEPRSLAEACDILGASPDARPIAGGTALLILIKLGLFVPTTLVNLGKVRGASGVTYDARSGLRLGALTPIAAVADSPLVRSHYPILATACRVVGNVRIRNLATIGGNVAHADSQSDPPTALVALGASLELVSSRGSRQLPLARFLLDTYETALEPGELVAAVTLPPPAPGTRSVYLRFTARSSEDRPCAGVAAVGTLRDGTFDDLRLVVGAASAIPVLVAGPGHARDGVPLDPETIGRHAAAAAESVDPVDDLRGPAAFKRHIVGVLAGRALSGLASGEASAP